MKGFGRFFVFSTLVLVGMVLAVERPDYSGEWLLDMARSKLEIPNVSGGTVRIAHQEPTFKFSRTFIKSGKPEDGGYELTTDGTEKVTNEEGIVTRSKLTWKDNLLLLDEVIQIGDRRATNTVSYSLEDGGKTLIARESFRGPRLKYDNIWVFTR